MATIYVEHSTTDLEESNTITIGNRITWIGYVGGAKRAIDLGSCRVVSYKRTAEFGKAATVRVEFLATLAEVPAGHIAELLKKDAA